MVMEEKELVRQLKNFLLEKIMDLFGLQSLMLVSNTGMYYVNEERADWVISWHHGNGMEREEEGIVTTEDVTEEVTNNTIEW
jgi:hypothetical protein